jgi:hypothetical protein
MLFPWFIRSAAAFSAALLAKTSGLSKARRPSESATQKRSRVEGKPDAWLASKKARASALSVLGNRIVCRHQNQIVSQTGDLQLQNACRGLGLGLSAQSDV